MKTRKRKYIGATVAEKACCQCKRVLPASEFYPCRKMRSGLQSQCRHCSRKWHRDRPDYVRDKNAKYKAKFPNYARDRQRFTRMGVTPGDVAALMKKQEGICPGCLRAFGVNLREHVDHCHTTGRVRGLLCNDCNVGMGRLGDDPVRMTRLVKYLEAEAH